MPSTVIAGIDYDLKERTLIITYVSGQAYKYIDVPESVYKELKASRVKGRYLRFFVKDQYEFTKLT
jgi:hypothetical protein